MIGQISRTIDRMLNQTGQRITRFLIEYRILISVMVIGFIVWAIVFNAAVVDYTSSVSWDSRTSWLGPFPDPDTVNIFGFTIQYQPEGYSDYSFYYVHWGYNFLYGTMPYSPDFGYLEMDGITNENGAHMFPPFTSYLYATGIWLGNLFGWENWGIGFLLAGFGFLTALPIYGISKELSSNRRVGEIAALTYLLNPLLLYHTDFLWFNPSPFVFFFFAGFYMLIREKRTIGTLLIVSAALFKQSAWFLGIPLVVYLLVKRRKRPSEDGRSSLKNGDLSGVVETPNEKPKPKPAIEALTDYFDLRGFAIGVIVVVLFVGAVMFPFLIAQRDFLNYWVLALGSFSFEGNFVDAPPYNVPQRIQVLLIMAGMPEQAEFLDAIITSGGPMIFGVVLSFGLMVLKDRYIGEEKLYLRRILFMTFMMMVLVNLVGARGVFKYYFVATVPFFSIFSSARMIRGSDEHVPFSASMAFLPIVFTLMILLPDRNYYLANLILIFSLYLLSPIIDRLYDLLKRQLGRLAKFNPISSSTISMGPTRTESKKAIFLTWLSRFLFIALGFSFFVIGLWISLFAVGANLLVGLTVVLVAAIALTLGPQLVSLTLSLNDTLKLNDNLKTYSFMTAAAIWIFGFGTYIQSWNVTLFSERQLLVISGIFVIIWAGSLLIHSKLYVRIFADLFLLGGIGLGLNVWVSLGNQLLQVTGILCVCAIIVHLVVALSVLIHNQSDIVETQDPENSEVAAPTP
ncbi:MAG: hypothetical protein ACFFEL_07195 [Candidatus Thorarchaeota archaeon]